MHGVDTLRVVASYDSTNLFLMSTLETHPDIDVSQASSLCTVHANMGGPVHLEQPTSSWLWLLPADYTQTVSLSRRPGECCFRMPCGEVSQMLFTHLCSRRGGVPHPS